MEFPFTLYSAVCCLCAGASLGSFLCILVGKVFHKHYVHARFSCACILLSCAVAAGTVALLVLPQLSFNFSGSDVKWFIGIIAAGIFCAISYRIIFPRVLLLYITVSFVFAVSFYKNFGTLPDSLSVRVENNSILVDNQLFSLPQTTSDKIFIELTVMQLPPKVLLPLPRIWYKISGINYDKDSSLENGEKKKLSSMTRQTDKKVDHAVFLIPFFRSFFDYSTRDSYTEFFLLPGGVHRTSDYILRFKDSSGHFSPRFINVL
jgi:hypothetical protein